MKKMKKLNLNKVQIVSLKNEKVIRGGNSVQMCKQSNHPDIDCDSTGITYGGNDDGTFKSAGQTTGGAVTQNCSLVLTECELADM